MLPVAFEGHNAVLGREQPEYRELPALIVGDECGTIITCWKLDDEDYASLIENEVLWLSQLTFGGKLQPQLPSFVKPFQTVEETELVKLKARYEELLFAVGMVHEGESRHETALRYIKEMEAPKTSEVVSTKDLPPSTANQNDRLDWRVYSCDDHPSRGENPLGL